MTDISSGDFKTFKQPSGQKQVFITSSHCGSLEGGGKDRNALTKYIPTDRRGKRGGSKKTSFIRDIKENNVIRFKYMLSICVSLASTTWGWTLGLMGPSLSELMVITGTDLEQGSVFITSYITGRLVGSVLGGNVNSRMHTYLIFVMSLVVHGATVAVIPWCSVYELMISAHIVQGMSGGILKVAITSTSMSIWGPTRRGRAYILILYICSSCAAALSALAITPFLNEARHLSVPHNTTNSNGPLNTDKCCPRNDFGRNDTHLNWTTYATDSHIYVAYSVSAGISFLVALLFLILYIRTKSRNSFTRYTTIKHDTFTDKHQGIQSKGQLINVGILSAVLHACTFTYTAYLTVFCVDHLKWTSSSGAMLTFLTVITSLGGRVIGISFVRFMQTQTVLSCAVAMYLLGFICMTVSAHLYVDIGIWLSTCIIGIPVGVIWPSTLSWTNSHLAPVGVKISSYLIVIGNIGTLSVPFLLGHLMQEISLVWFCYVSVILSAIVTINVFFLVVHTKGKYDLYDVRRTFKRETFNTMQQSFNYRQSNMGNNMV